MKSSRLFFLASSLALVACAFLVDTTGLRDDAGAPVDAALDTSDVVAPDVTPDAGPDVFDFVCPDAAIVCDDFDESPLGARWTSVRMQGSGVLAIDNGVSFSAPSSLLVWLPDNPSALPPPGEVVLQLLERELRASGAALGHQRDERRRHGPAARGHRRRVQQIRAAREDRRPELGGRDRDRPGRRGGRDEQHRDARRVLRQRLASRAFHHGLQALPAHARRSTALDKALSHSLFSKASGKIFVGSAFDSESARWRLHIDDVLCTGVS